MLNIVELVSMRGLKPVEMEKDIGLLPIYLKDLYKDDINIEIRYLDSNQEPSNISSKGNIKVFPIKVPKIFSGKLDYIVLLNYLLLNRKKIDILILYHLSIITAIIGIFYKIFNRRGKIYLKLDMNIGFAKTIDSSRYKRLYRYFISKLSLCSCETKSVYYELKKTDIFKKNNLIYMPNGFDDNYFQKDIDDNEKDNIFITVGRIGAIEKNHSDILKILSKIDLKKWKFIFIGPIEEEFNKEIKSFFLNNPTLRDSVIFKGEIKDKNELFSYYRKAKVFVLSSAWESFCFSLIEALFFGNYILSTNVGIASSIIEESVNGEIITIEQIEESMKNIIEKHKKIKLKQCLKKRKSWKYSEIMISNKKYFDAIIYK